MERRQPDVPHGPVDQEAFRRQAMCPRGATEARQSGRHGRQRRPGRARLDQRDGIGRAWHQEVHLEPLLIAEVVELAPVAGVQLLFDDLRKLINAYGVC
jgi:hypothetical protein